MPRAVSAILAAALCGCAPKIVSVPIYIERGSRYVPPPRPVDKRPLLGARQLAASTGTPERLCALFDDKVRCLTHIGHPQLVDLPLPGRGRQLALGQGWGCVLSEGGAIDCFGYEAKLQRVSLPPAEALFLLDAPSAYVPRGVCGRGGDGVISCAAVAGPGAPQSAAWDLRLGQPGDAARPTAPIHARAIVEGCAIGEGPLVCAPYADARWAQALLSRGLVDWRSGQSTVYDRGQATIARHALGLDAAGRLAGQGSSFYGQLGGGAHGKGEGSSSLAALGPVSSFAVGPRHACAVFSGRVACFGDATDGQVPRGAQVEIGSCPVDDRRTRAEWRARAEAGNAAQQQSYQACIAQPRALDCALGRRYEDPSKPPPSASVYRSDGRCIEHWEPARRVLEPAPVFVPDLDDAVQVVVGETYSCALRRGGAVRCWGKSSLFALDPAGSPYRP